MSQTTPTTYPTKRVKLSALTLLPETGSRRNVRVHSDYQLAELQKSIERFGFTETITIDKKGVVLSGNARVKAALAAGLKEIDAVQVPFQGKQALAYIIAMNRLAELAEWNAIGLLDQLGNIGDLSGIGFDDDAIAELRRQVDADRQLLEDPAPEKPKKPVTKPGQIWKLGNHRLLCGDATSEMDVKRLFRGAMPELMVTDPPYGVNYDPAWREQVKGKLGAVRAHGKVQNDDQVDWSPALALFPGDVIYQWHAGVYAGTIAAQLEKLGYDIRAQIVWRKQQFAISRGHYHWQHEPCWYAVRSGKKALWVGDRSQSTIWDIASLNPFGGQSDDDFTDHGTQKPIECMARPLRNHDAREVYDPFVGSGTTILAAEQLERKCYAIDIDPGYCDVSVQRWEHLTGGKAHLLKS